MSTTMKVAIHLGPNYAEHLEVYRNTNFEELQNLFDITQKLILDHQAEILNVTTIDWTSPSWTRSTQSHDQEISSTKSTRLLRFRHGKVSDHSEANRRWENLVKEFQKSTSYRD